MEVVKCYGMGERDTLLDYQLAMNEKFRSIKDLRYYASRKDIKSRVQLPTERDLAFF